MVDYNTALPKLEMREYGRHIQKLIKHCMSLETKEERTKCAYAIAEIMTHLFPDLNGEEKNSRKVWDHINLIANYKLDIDFPFDIREEEELNKVPEKIPYPKKTDRFRIYGSNLVGMIREISKMEGGVDKDRLIFLVANQMKKLLISENQDSATDRRVFNDIKEITGGAIDIDPTSYKLNEYIGITNPQEGKKKKKK